MKTLALIGADLIVEPRKNTTADSGLVMGGLIVPKNTWLVFSVLRRSAMFDFIHVKQLIVLLANIYLYIRVA